MGPLPALFLGVDFIPYVFKAKNLGVTFSYDLNWGDHVSTIGRSMEPLLGRCHLFCRLYTTCSACDSVTL
jgi:hypothetical protein